MQHPKTITETFAITKTSDNDNRYVMLEREEDKPVKLSVSAYDLTKKQQVFDVIELLTTLAEELEA